MAGVASAMAETSDSTKVVTEEPKQVINTDVAAAMPTPDYNKAASMATSVKELVLNYLFMKKLV